MHKEKFDSEAEANAYKEKHKLYGRKAVPLALSTKWALIFDLECHIEVRNGAPDTSQRLGAEV